jgi:hypothetical protein
MDFGDRKTARAAMPDVVWTLLADPANRPMLALTLAGLVVIVFGPWAIVKLAQRRSARSVTRSDPLSEAKIAKGKEIGRRYRNAIRTQSK